MSKVEKVEDPIDIWIERNLRMISAGLFCLVGVIAQVGGYYFGW